MVPLPEVGEAVWGAVCVWCAQGNHWPLADEVDGVDLATTGACRWGENKLRW